MTSPVAVVQLNYDGVDLCMADLSIMFEIVTGLWDTPKQRGDDVVVAQAAGRSERITINDTLPIVLRGVVQADPALTDPSDIRSDFVFNMRAIRTLFHSSNLRAPLRATLPGGTVLEISAKPLNIMTSDYIDGECWTGTVGLDGFDDWTEVS